LNHFSSDSFYLLIVFTSVRDRQESLLFERMSNVPFTPCPPLLHRFLNVDPSLVSAETQEIFDAFVKVKGKRIKSAQLLLNCLEANAVNYHRLAVSLEHRYEYRKILATYLCEDKHEENLVNNGMSLDTYRENIWIPSMVKINRDFQWNKYEHQAMLDECWLVDATVGKSATQRGSRLLDDLVWFLFPKKRKITTATGPPAGNPQYSSVFFLCLIVSSLCPWQEIMKPITITRLPVVGLRKREHRKNENALLLITVKCSFFLV
jgi:hypothetical protein